MYATRIWCLNLKISFVSNSFTLKEKPQQQPVFPKMRCVSIFVGLVAVVFALAIVVPKRVDIPSHLINHPIIDLENFLSEQTVDDLLQLTRDFGIITTAAREYDSYTALRDNIGEAVPFNKTSGKCPDAFLMPNGDKTSCVFPGRVDVGRHYVRSGGIEGLKESYDTLVTRVQPFQKYMFDYPKYPVAKGLLESPEFQKLAKGVCPAHKQFLDSFQVNLIVQVPRPDRGPAHRCPLLHACQPLPLPTVVPCRYGLLRAV
jgi:hypothetical protein